MNYQAAAQANFKILDLMKNDVLGRPWNTQVNTCSHSLSQILNFRRAAVLRCCDDLGEAAIREKFSLTDGEGHGTLLSSNLEE
jgi:hypothetical protein